MTKIEKSELKKKALAKANTDIGYTIQRGSITFVGRKIHNALVYHAQRLTVAGKGVLPGAVNYDTSEIANFKDRWWIAMSDLIEDGNIGDGNHRRVKSMLLDLMAVVVDREADGDSWQSDQILSSVKIVGTKTISDRSQGDKLYLGWSFPSTIEKFMLSPFQENQRYTRLNLYYQSQLSSEPALVLYEICKRIATSPRGVTGAAPWEEWAKRFNTKNTSNFKYFNRDVLKLAIAEVNKNTDITVKPTIIRAGARVSEIDFEVKLKPQADLELGLGVVTLDKTIVAKLEGYGISFVQQQNLIKEYGEEKIAEALDLLTARIGDSALAPLRSPAAYLKSSLAGDYAAGTKKAGEKTKLAAEKADAAARKRIVDSTAAQTAAAAAAGKALPAPKVAPAAPDATRDVFLALDDDQRAVVFGKYIATLSAGDLSFFAAWKKSGTWGANATGKKFFAWFAAQ